MNRLETDKDKISIIIATYGDRKWQRLAESHALPSAIKQKAHEIILYHDDEGTAATCKNYAIKMAKHPWIVICDADDQLEDGYCEAMAKSKGDLRYPMVRYITDGYPSHFPLPAARVLGSKHLLQGNYMVIGTMMRRNDILGVGGYSEFDTWEDWYLLMQLNYLGAVPVLCRDAIYRAYQHKSSRVSDTKNPSELFLSMKESFRKWALEFNGGVTNDPEYKKFLVPGTGLFGGYV